MHLGERIRERWEQYGFALDDVARLSGLTPERVKQIADGSTPSTFELARLCDAVVVEPYELMRNDELESDPRRSVARFRRGESAAEISPDDLRWMSLAAELARVGEHLRGLLGKPVSRIDEAREVRAITSDHPGKEGAQLGLAARLQLHDDGKPIFSVRGLLEAWGVHVAEVELRSPGVEAVSLFESGAVPVILLNRQHPRVRLPLSRRAVLAHELCHLLHDGGERDVATVVSREASNDPMEQRANGFAPSFLAPDPWLRKDSTLPEDPDDLVFQVGRRWGLSYEGAVRHANNIGLIDGDVAEALMTRHTRLPVELEPPVERRPAPEGLSPSPMANGIIADWAMEAYEEDLISLGRLEEILNTL